jgi:lipopolysaccharide/colanic/teichoic acid biosynthesis glycosyltransferase
MLKRSFDFIVSGVGIVILSPLFILIAFAVYHSSDWPVLYRAKRVGQWGKEFHLYKFRSMVVDADRQGSGITSSYDSRITPIGHFLRQTKLDELPQLINVFRGEMSLVGPRPEDPRYVRLYKFEQRAILQYRPGITSKASLQYRNEQQMLSGPNWDQTYIEIIMPSKLNIDLEYAQRANLLSDLVLIFQTIFSG